MDLLEGLPGLGLAADTVSTGLCRERTKRWGHKDLVLALQLRSIFRITTECRKLQHTLLIPSTISCLWVVCRVAQYRKETGAWLLSSQWKMLADKYKIEPGLSTSLSEEIFRHKDRGERTCFQTHGTWFSLFQHFAHTEPKISSLIGSSLKAVQVSLEEQAG